MKTIEISVKEYKDLLKSSIELEMMQWYGVDNWEGYGECFNPCNGEKSLQDYFDEIGKEYPED